MRSFIGPYLKHMKEHGRHHLVVSLFMANVVLLTKPVWYGIEDAIAQKSNELALAGGTTRERWRAGVATVKIDPNHYANPATYAGRSPLNRCALTRDLQRLLQVEGITTVAVDLDLSPTERASFVTSGANTDRYDKLGQPETLNETRVELECQNRLNKLLVEPRNARRLILMLPLASQHTETQNKIDQWQALMTAAGVQLASVDLTLKRGVLRTYEPEYTPGTPREHPTFSEALRHRLAAQVAGTAGPKPTAISPEELGSSDISFRVLRDLFKSPATGSGDVDLDDACLLPRFRSCGLHTVILGAGYSSDDEYLTPVGLLNGVDVHAALAVCPSRTKAQARMHHLVDHAQEIALCTALLAPIMFFFWAQYFHARWNRPHPSPYAAQTAGSTKPLALLLTRLRPAQPETAYVWLIAMAAVLFSLLAGYMVLSPLWISNCDVISLPPALVVGLLLEACMVQGVVVASQEGAHFHQDHRTRLPFHYSAKGDWRAVSAKRARWLVYDLVLIGAAVVIWQH